MNKNILTLAAGFSLLFPVLFWLVKGEGPTLLYPFPAVMFIPSFFLKQWAVIVPVALFFLWNIGLFRGEARVPKRSYFLLTAATLLSVVWFGVGWKDGIAIEGAKYNWGVAAINVVWLSLLWLLFTRARNKNISFGSTLFLHWVLFAWLAWFAFPFFGELI